MWNATKTSTLVNNKAVTLTGVPTNVYLYIFCRNINNTSADTSNYDSTIIYYLKLWQGTTLVRDFIPCRIGETGYMFDKVTETLFENNGTQSFTLGEDII